MIFKAMKTLNAECFVEFKSLAVRPPWTVFCFLLCLPMSAAFGGNCVQCKPQGVTVIAENSLGDREKKLKGLRFQPSATLVMDYGRYDGVFSGGEDIHELRLRKARVGMLAKFRRPISTEIVFDIDTYAQSEVSIHSLELNYKAAKNKEVKFGWLKQPFGLESNTSSKNIRTLERSIATDLFAPERALGLVWQLDGKKYHFSNGVFVDSSNKQDIGLAGRFVWNPIDSKLSVLHAGLSANYQFLSGEQYDRKSDASQHDGKNVVSIEGFTPDASSTLGVEGAWMRGSFSLQGEWIAQQLLLNTAEKDPIMVGGYMQAGWVFGGGYRKYSKGEFKKLTAARGKQVTDLVVGYGYVDARYSGGGAIVKELSATVNRYLNSSIRVSAQLTKIEKTVGDNESTDDGMSLNFRLQADY